MAATTTMTDAPIVVDVPLDAAIVAPQKKKRHRPATLATGNRIGAWRVESQLGRGGMASVYAVTHARFGKRAALKLAHRAILGPAFTRETFLREARIVHLVNHPGVPDVFATGTFDGRPYLVMERLTGETLGELRDRSSGSGELGRARAVEILRAICDVLGTAHEAGVVHRDLKLDNVFVEQTGRVRLLDWGVARIVGEEDPLRGMVAGTLTYVAPEQLRGHDITTAADVYSLGVLAYQLLLGAAPFVANGEYEMCKQHLEAVPPPPATRWAEIPKPLEKLLLDMLDKDPERRPTLQEVSRVLGALRLERAPSPRLAWLSLHLVPAIDVLGRPAVQLGPRQRVATAALGLVIAAATVASLFVSV
jgi:serine/threonine-protein kinase